MECTGESVIRVKEWEGMSGESGRIGDGDGIEGVSGGGGKECSTRAKGKV